MAERKDTSRIDGLLAELAKELEKEGKADSKNNAEGLIDVLRGQLGDDDALLTYDIRVVTKEETVARVAGQTNINNFSTPNVISSSIENMQDLMDKTIWRGLVSQLCAWLQSKAPAGSRQIPAGGQGGLIESRELSTSGGQAVPSGTPLTR
jgi:hypothetical protein